MEAFGKLGSAEASASSAEPLTEASRAVVTVPVGFARWHQQGSFGAEGEA